MLDCTDSKTTKLPSEQCCQPSATNVSEVVNDIHSRLNETRVRRIERPNSIDEVLAIIAQVKRERLSLCIAGGRHSMGGQAFATDGVLVDTQRLNRVVSFDVGSGLIEVEAGIQWPQLLDFLQSAQHRSPTSWTFAQKQTGADRLSIGGCVSSNIHGRGLTYAPFATHVVSMKIVDANGSVIECSRTKLPELFNLVVGGYGLFGFIYSATLQLVPRQKLERVVEVRNVDGLQRAFAQRIEDGFLYGDFQFAVDPNTDAFLNRGVFSCYRPVADGTPMPPTKRELAEADWVNLIHLAHVNKAEAFDRYASYYLSTHGQLYWSDDHQMTIYPDDYHAELDRRMNAPHCGSEMITEIYCERDRLESFIGEVRAAARTEKFDIIYGTIRLIEKDTESFLAWAKKPYACVIFNLHVSHDDAAKRAAENAFRKLIDIGIRHGGSYYLTYHRYATREQVAACYPQLQQFLSLKRQHDPQELFQSDWYRHYRQMFTSTPREER